MDELSLLSRVSLYLVLTLVALFSGLLFWFQAQVLIGKAMPNPDGTFDDWHRQRIFFGIAFADLVFTVPLSVAAIALSLQGSHWGHYLLTMLGYFYVWSNTMTTATSLRFEKPKITLMWFFVFPLGILVGVCILAWTTAHAAFLYGV